ncbi:MAG: membrane protein insertion efficiency factor YidD [Coxiellaceae bacterium]|nr:membrane protein insertion efficiency factor YidD [Coxiellaceae bacterium]
MLRAIIAACYSAPRQALIGLVWVYQRGFSRFSRAHCRFYPSCSEYAKQAFNQRGALIGLAYTVKRLLKCHPLHAGGFDPVPKKQKK